MHRATQGGNELFAKQKKDRAPCLDKMFRITVDI